MEPVHYYIFYWGEGGGAHILSANHESMPESLLARKLFENISTGKQKKGGGGGEFLPESLPKSYPKLPECRRNFTRIQIH